MNASFAQIRCSRQALRPLLLAALLAVLGGCATLPPPTAELTAAQQAVSRANDADADQYAPDVVATARSELAQAQAAMAKGREGDARTMATAAAAAGDLAYAQSHAETLHQDYQQRRGEIANLRRQLQVGAEAGADADITPADSAMETGDPAMRLQALDADPRLNGLAAYQRLQARQAVEALATVRSSQRANATVLAARRVSIAELAARSELTERAIDRLDRSRSELLVEASRREAERARQEAERLRVQAQIQAEETQRLRAAAEAEAAARQQAEDVIIDVGGEQAAKLKAARKREADLARQEAELMAAQKAAEAGNSDDSGD
jgi:hypothetical protein